MRRGGWWGCRGGAGARGHPSPGRWFDEGAPTRRRPSPHNLCSFKKELKKRRLTPADYTGDVDGLPSLDLAPSTQRGAPAALGDRVTVHWDSLYRGIDVASSRAARLLGGNRTVAEPLDFTVGGPVTALARAAVAESSGGLFSGMGGPQPPPALSTAVLGMRAGDKRALLIPPERGYGDRGLGEMPGGATFELRVEVLAVEPGGKE